MTDDDYKKLNNKLLHSRILFGLVIIFLAFKMMSLESRIERIELKARIDARHNP